MRVLPYLVPRFALNAALVALGAYLIVQSIRRLRQHDALIRKLKHDHSVLAHLIE